jgi:phage recombination protein Bet
MSIYHVATQARALALVDDSSFQEKLEAYKQTYAPSLTNAELSVFGEACRRMGLDPFARQIYVVKNGPRLQIMVAIDGQRAIAERSEKYAGQVGPFWCGKDGVWHDAWIADESPVACKVGIKRRDFDEIMWGVARFKSFRKATPNWTDMPDVMLAVRAETQALRRTFPNQLSGVYTPDEMGFDEDTAAPYVETTAEPAPRQLPRQTWVEDAPISEPSPEIEEPDATAEPEIDDATLTSLSRSLAEDLGIIAHDYAKAFYANVNEGKPLSPKEVTRAHRKAWYAHLKKLQAQREAVLAGGEVEELTLETPTEEAHDLATLDPREVKVS